MFKLIPRSLLELLFEAASMQRWNDHIRPHHGFSELDKQAHKMVFAWIIGKMEEKDRGCAVDWRGLIEGGIFELLHRIKLTDLKPPIFHKLMEKKSRELNDWVLEQLHESIEPLADGFASKMRDYLFRDDFWPVEKKILRAAHYLATNWEFEIIYRLNSTQYGIEETSASITNEIEEHFDLAGVQKIWLGKKTRNFLDLIGQLRFQQRWAHSPRVPGTSVMGHMLVVAVLAYLVSVEIGACNRRIYNNFFGGLFHDLPEVMTRDIISPIKEGVSGLDSIIKEIETRQLEEKVLPLLPAAWHREIRYFVEKEFQSKILREGNEIECTSDEISERYNRDEFYPMDGEIIKICDKLAAYIEASLSISYGIRAPQLVNGRRGIMDKYGKSRVAGFDFSSLFEYFKKDDGS